MKQVMWRRATPNRKHRPLRILRIHDESDPLVTLARGSVYLIA